MYKMKQPPRPQGPYQRNAWPPRQNQIKKEHPKPVFEKTREILRHIYPANASGSKIVTISLDPAFDFEPAVTFAKPGFAGVKLDTLAFFELCNNAEYISAYFRGEVAQAGQMQLSHDVTLAFELSYGHLAIVLKYAVQTPAEKTVTLARATWIYLCGLMPLLQHLHKGLSDATPSANQMCADMVRFIGANLRPAGGRGATLIELEEFMKNMQPKDITEAEGVDKERVFYELRQFCIFDIAGALNMNTEIKCPA